MRGQPCPRGGLGPSGEGSHPAGCTRAWPRGLRGRRGWHQADPSGASRVPSSPPPAGPWTAHSGRVTLDVGASVCPVALRVRLRCPRRGGSRASAPASRAPPWVCRPSRPLGPEAEPPGGWPPSVGASARGDGFAEGLASSRALGTNESAAAVVQGARLPAALLPAMRTVPQRGLAPWR